MVNFSCASLVSRIGLKKLTENKIISNFKFGTFHLGKQHYYSLEQLKKQCSIYFSNQLPFQQNDTQMVTYPLSCSTIRVHRDFGYKIHDCLFLLSFPTQKSIKFFQAEGYQKEIQRNLNKSTNQAFAIMHSKRTCTVTKWLPGKKV